MLHDLDIQTIIPLSAALLNICLGLFALIGARGSTVYRIFALGMFFFAAEQFFSFLAIGSGSLAEFRRSEFLSMLTAGFAYCAWFAFSICYGREDWEKDLRGKRWVVLAAGVLPAAIISLFYASLFAEIHLRREWIISLGQPAFVYYILTLMIAVFILVNIEKTLRSSIGAIRWRIKFMLLGIGFLFAARIYCTAEKLMFVGDSFQFSAIESGSLLFADCLIIISIVRSKLKDITVHVSQDFLYNSTAMVIIGVYLLTLGVVAKIATYFGVGAVLLRNAFLILMAVVGVAALFLSGDVQYRIKKFIARHFKRPLYDYKKIWESLTKRTVSLVNLQDLCTAVANTIAETFGVSSVSIWLYEESKRPALFGSTDLSFSQQLDPNFESEIGFLMLSMQNKQELVRLGPSISTSEELPVSEALQPGFRRVVHCCTPLVAGGSFLGIITLGPKPQGEEFTFEDLDLLKTIADQTGGFILNLKLFESLGQAREMRAFQNLSAFFIHDLKNLASTLALTLQNLPTHYDNPEYRQDALKIIGGSVEKIQVMCSRLSAFNQKPDMNFMFTDLNGIVLSAISDFENCADMVVDPELNSVPAVNVDPDKIRSVLSNLIINAREASAEKCVIRISTSLENGYAVISVRDNGCGMPREFIEKNLFKPFKSTKTKGLGIGLYQGKIIVESHRGRIEVESEEGKGSEFRILLPVPE